MHIKLRFIIYICLGISHFAQAFAAFTPALGRTDSNHCATYIYQHERLKNIPTHLLGAIAKVESGRYNPKTNQVVAWPWTINVNGQGHYFSTKNEAVRYVKDLLAKGNDSIDVGCMQVNLRHHPDAFPSIEAAFDPRTNVEYAAKFLTNLKNSLGSWKKAVAYYHSANAEHHIPYRKKVYEIWQKERSQKHPFLVTEQETSYGPYMVGYGLHGKIYRRPLSREHRLAQQNDLQFRLNDARYQLAQYREHAARTLEHSERIKHQRATATITPKIKNDPKAMPPAYKRAVPNPYRFIKRASPTAVQN